MTLTQTRLKELLHYDPETGLWTWLQNRQRIRAGNRAGTISKVDRYTHIIIEKKNYMAHRLAWLYMTGEWPSIHIDHKDTNRSNNRWINLRLASRMQNQANRGRQSNNKSGHKGVWWNKQNQNWRARIKVGDNYIELGSHKDLETAATKYAEAAKKYYGEFARVV